MHKPLTNFNVLNQSHVFFIAFGAEAKIFNYFAIKFIIKFLVKIFDHFARSLGALYWQLYKNF
jgi:hypothetical protein